MSSLNSGRSQIIKSENMLEIIIHPYGINFQAVFAASFGTIIALMSAIFLKIIIVSLTQIEFSGFCFLLSIVVILTSISAWTFYYFVLPYIAKITLQITQFKISKSWKILGLHCYPPRTASRQDIKRIELIRPLYSYGSQGYGINGYNFIIFHQINVWAGSQRFSLGGEEHLVILELENIANELSNWLNHPVYIADR